MNRPTAALVVVLLFVSGLVIGVMGTHLYYFYRLRGFEGPRGGGVGFIAEAIERDLALSPGQARRVEEIVGRARQRAFELRRDTLPRMREIMEEATRDIRAVLTPEQRARFDALRARRGRWLERTMLDGGPHGPGPGGPGFRGPGPPGAHGPYHDRPAPPDPDEPPPPEPPTEP